MKKFFIAAAGIFILTSCSTVINTRWQNKNITSQKYNKILVLAIAKDKEENLQLNLERHVAGDLKFLGYHAVSSTEEFGVSGIAGLNEKNLMGKLTSGGFDAVFTVVLLDKKKERFYVPAKVQYTPYSPYYNRLPGYFETMNNRVMSEGYYEEQTKYFLECNFYRVDNKELLYSAQTVSFESGSINTLAHQYGKTVILDMVKRKIFLKPDESSLYQKSF